MLFYNACDYRIYGKTKERKLHSLSQEILGEELTDGRHKMAHSVDY